MHNFIIFIQNISSEGLFKILVVKGGCMKKYKNYIYLFFILILASLNFNIILKSLNLVTGGTQGLALILNNILNLHSSTIILIINLLMLVLSYFMLSKQATYGTIFATFVYPLCVKMTSFIDITLNDNSIILYVLIAGIICGITGGLIFRLGYSSGGISVLVLVMKKYFNLKESISNFIINATIIVLGAFFFSIKKAIYSIILILISSIIINKIVKRKNN